MLKAQMVAIACLVDGFSSPNKLNIRSVATVNMVIDLYKSLSSAGHNVQIWINKSTVIYPNGKMFLYEIVKNDLLERKIPESRIRLTNLPSFNALTDGATLTDYAIPHPMDQYIFVVPNFSIYFQLTYQAMRKYMGDGKKWENMKVISACIRPKFKKCLLYGLLILITLVASKNKTLWKTWFELRLKEKNERENGFISTVGD